MLDFNVKRCRYAETYRAMGLGEIGAILSCNRDGAFCEGYDPRIKPHPHPDDHGRGEPLRFPLPLAREAGRLKADGRAAGQEMARAGRI